MYSYLCCHAKWTSGYFNSEYTLPGIHIKGDVLYYVIAAGKVTEANISKSKQFE